VRIAESSRQVPEVRFVMHVYWEIVALFRRHSGVGLPAISAESDWHDLPDRAHSPGAAKLPRSSLAALHRSKPLQGQSCKIMLLMQVYWETAALFRRHSGVGLPGMSAQSEWHNLRQDLIELIAPGQPEIKQKICQRMQRVYSLFQP